MYDFFEMIWGRLVGNTVCRVLGHREVQKAFFITPPDGGDEQGRTGPIPVVSASCARCGCQYVSFTPEAGKQYKATWD